MKLTDALLGEHAAFYGLFDEIESMVSAEIRPACIESAMTVLNTLVLAHAKLEDELLFVALDRELGAEGPQSVMRQEHTEMVQLLEKIEIAANADDAIKLCLEAIVAARDHFQKEEAVLFPLARQVLGKELLSQLGEEWARTRNVVLSQ